MFKKPSQTVGLTSTIASALQGEARIPGDKSISHRALMLSSQFLGKTTIHGLLEGEDVLRTAAALRHLGATIDQGERFVWTVQGVGIGGLSESSEVLDMGNSGTSTRLMMGLLTPYPFISFFTGDASLRSRPMARVSRPLQEMGAQVVSRSNGRLPLALVGTADPLPITYTLPVASAQVKSAILLAGLNTPGVTTVIEPEVTRDHTERMLNFFGYPVTCTPHGSGMSVTLKGCVEVTPQDRTIQVPADPSSAAFVVVAALLVPYSNMLLKSICINPLRTGLFTTLLEMGADIKYENKRTVAGEEVADLRIKHSSLKGVEVSASRAPSMIDEYPILAVAAAMAKGTTTMHGLAELRVKESDRFNAIVEGLSACGIAVKAEGDSLFVEGGKPKGGATIKTNLDHRIAMAFLVMGMVSQKPVIIDDGDAIQTSFPGFVGLMNRLGAAITLRADPRYPTKSHHYPPMVVAIDGPAASGKGTLARRLAEHLGCNYLDTGSLYRAVGMKLIYSDKDPQNKEDAIAAAKSIDIDDLANPRLRQERIGRAASIVSAHPEVRDILLDYQRNFAKQPGGAVLDGRDIGTVVCPDANLKLFITADLDARAKRRHRELQGEGIEVVYDSVLAELKERDKRDSERGAAPLVAARDAIHIDTSEMDANRVFSRVISIIDARIRENVA